MPRGNQCADFFDKENDDLDFYWEVVRESRDYGGKAEIGLVDQDLSYILFRIVTIELGDCPKMNRSTVDKPDRPNFPVISMSYVFDITKLRASGI